MKELWSDSSLNDEARYLLDQTVQLLRRSAISEGEFTLEVDRIVGEHLSPHGLNMVVRRLPDGTVRFLVNGPLGVYDIIDCLQNSLDKSNRSAV